MNYKFEESIQKIKNFMREKNDYVTLKIVKVQKVHLMYLKKLDEKMIERIMRHLSEKKHGGLMIMPYSRSLPMSTMIQDGSFHGPEN